MIHRGAALLKTQKYIQKGDLFVDFMYIQIENVVFLNVLIALNNKEIT